MSVPEELAALGKHESFVYVVDGSRIKYTRVHGGFIATLGEPGGRCYIPLTEVINDGKKATGAGSKARKRPATKSPK